MELVLFIGLQAAGKSTFYRTHFADTHTHISRDNFRNARNGEKRQLQLLEEAFTRGDSVVVDNTNLSLTSRVASIEIGQRFAATIIGYYFESRLGPCLERNSRREGHARVPDVAIFAAVKRLERPTMTEGFDQLFYVRMIDGGSFEVESWKNEASLPAETNDTQTGQKTETPNA